MNEARKRRRKWRLTQAATLLIPVSIALALLGISLFPL